MLHRLRHGAASNQWIIEFSKGNTKANFYCGISIPYYLEHDSVCVTLIHSLQLLPDISIINPSYLSELQLYVPYHPQYGYT